MFENFDFLLLSLVSLYLGVWLLSPSGKYYNRFLGTGSFFCIFILAPFAALTCLIMCLTVQLINSFGEQKNKKWLQISSSILLILIVISARQVEVFSGIELFGVSFALIRLLYFVNVKQKYNTSFSNILFLVFFLPLYSSGPIASLDVLMKRTGVSVTQLIDSIFRIIVGLFKATFLSSVLLSELIQNIQTFQTETSASYFIVSYLTILLLFLKIYVSFSGISDIAIGLSRFFGFTIPENFDRPFLATSVQDFWKRWHITMSSTISKLVFLRFVRKTGRAKLGIFITFFAIGMWHEISLGYLIWSLMHAGGVMASRMVIFTFPFNGKGVDEPRYVIYLKRILVWSYVSYASYQANHFEYGKFFQ